MSNNKGIRISPKYGVNPTIPICFFCGEEKHEIALLGKIGGRNKDLEAPRHMILNYEPCEECKKKMDTGITLIEITDIPNSENQPPIAENAYPTGNWWVVTEDFIRNNIQPPELAEQIIQHRKTLVVAGAITFRPKDTDAKSTIPGADAGAKA